MSESKSKAQPNRILSGENPWTINIYKKNSNNNSSNQQEQEQHILVLSFIYGRGNGWNKIIAFEHHVAVYENDCSSVKNEKRKNTY